MLTFRRIKKEDSNLMISWFNDDLVGIKFLPTYIKLENYFHLIDFQKRHLWIVLEDNTPIGFTDLEIRSKEKSYFSFYIAPKFRGSGNGYGLIKEFLKLPEVKNLKFLEGGVAIENIPSQKILEKAGFVRSGTDRDGFLIYRLGL